VGVVVVVVVVKVWPIFLRSRNKPGMRKIAKHSSGKKKKQIQRYTTLFFTTVFLVARREFFLFSGVREQNLCLFLPTRRDARETLDKMTGEKKTTAGGVSFGPAFFIRSADNRPLCVCASAALVFKM
jgi:hypothetical protein